MLHTCISLRRLRIEVKKMRRKVNMVRLALYIFGVSTILTAWALYKNQQSADPTRRVPAKKAAEMLQEAWSDYHTRA